MPGLPAQLLHPACFTLYHPPSTLHACHRSLQPHPHPCWPWRPSQGLEAVQPYLRECKQLGFDYVELSTGFISLPTEDLVRLVRDVKAAGLQPKPEVRCGGRNS